MISNTSGQLPRAFSTLSFMKSENLSFITFLFVSIDVEKTILVSSFKELEDKIGAKNSVDTAIKSLNFKVGLNGISNVEKRIRELEENLSSYNIRIDKLQSSIFAYQLEISRLRAKEKANSSNSKNV